MDNSSDALRLMSMPGELVLSADGKWYHDGVFVSHARIARYFSQHLQWSKRLNSFVVSVDSRCVKVVVEDLPFFVCAFRLVGEELQQLLNTEEWEVVSKKGFSVSSDQRWTSYSQSKKCQARVSRAALQSLLPCVESAHDSKGELIYCVIVGSVRYPLVTTP